MTEQNTVYFGKTNFRDSERVFGMKQADRRQHMYVIGQTGTGKSTFLKNVALQDIKSGRGMCIVDPHGEFVEDVLTMVPPERVKDVIYFNPADAEYPIGFNVLEVPDINNPEYKPIAASSLMGIFTKIWANVWSARMEYILNNAILALLDNPGSTLLGVQRILVDSQYRKEILSHVKDPVVRAFWLQEYEQYEPRFRNEAIAPIQNKVGQFLSSSIIRNIVGQPHSSLNLYDSMNAEKIILVNVSKGRIGEDNSQLLGAMVITKLQLAAMERVRIPEEERKDFYLYVDEFQNFATDSFASILSEARKYRLNLVMAHQYIGQLVTETSTRVRDAVFGNVGTMAVFRVGAADAEFLEKEFAPELTIEDLVGLPNHQIFIKLMINNVRSRPFSANTLPPLRIETEKDSALKIIDHSRAEYSRTRARVEEEIASWSGFAQGKEILATPLTKTSGKLTYTPSRQKFSLSRKEQTSPKSDNLIRDNTFSKNMPIPASSKNIPSRSTHGSGNPIAKQSTEDRRISLSQLVPKQEIKSSAPTSFQVKTVLSKQAQEKKHPLNLLELRSTLSKIMGKREDNPKELPQQEELSQKASLSSRKNQYQTTGKERGGGRLEPGKSIKL